MDKDNKQAFYRYIPGFRKRKILPFVLAASYYFAMILGLISGKIFTAIFGISLPFILVYGYEYFRNRKDPFFSITKKKIFYTSILIAILSFLFLQIREENNPNKYKNPLEDILGEIETKRQD